MKKNILAALIVFLMSATVSHAITVKIHGKLAKRIYLNLTGHDIQNEAAMGHVYRQGKSINCRYVEVEMSLHGKPVPTKNPARYECTMQIDNNGLASSSQRF